MDKTRPPDDTPTRPDLDAILARADAVPTCELLVQGKNARTTRAQVFMDDAGDLRFVADVNENWGPYADLFAAARTDIPALVAYARELETTLAWHEDRHGTRAEQEADDAEVEEEWSAVAALSDDEVRALNEAEGIDGPAQRQRFDTFLRVLARDAALRAERDELLLVIANERGEGEPPVPGWQWNPHARYWHCGTATVFWADYARSWWWDDSPSIGRSPESRGPHKTAREAIRAASRVPR